MKNILFWFSKNLLKTNVEKFQLLVLNRLNHRKQRMVIISITVKKSNEVILLDITIDNKLLSKKHIENSCRTDQQKLYTLRSIRKSLSLDKVILLGNTFINSQFNYAPIIWMFCRKTLCRKIEKPHDRSIKLIFKSEEFCENFLLQRSSVFVPQRHMRFLVAKFCKSATQINPAFMWRYFGYNNITCNSCSFFVQHAINYYGTNSLHLHESLIRNNLPGNIKYTKSLTEFKAKIINFGNIHCGCKMWLICSQANLYFKSIL